VGARARDANESHYRLLDATKRVLDATKRIEKPCI
jgi:hypothetical protein